MTESHKAAPPKTNDAAPEDSLKTQLDQAFLRLDHNIERLTQHQAEQANSATQNQAMLEKINAALDTLKTLEAVINNANLQP